MKISREIIINGESQNTEYELTGIELERCFNEYQSQKDKDLVVHYLRDAEYEDVDNIPEEIIADLASQFRNNIDSLIDDSMTRIINRNEDSLEEYKEKWKVFSTEVTLTLTHEYTIKARNREEAKHIFESWSENNCDQMEEDLVEDARYNGDWDYGYMYEDDSTDPDCADISKEDV